MKNRLTSLLITSAAICLMAAMGAAIAADPGSTAAPVLRVGVTPNAPPMIFKEGKNITGVEADFAIALGRNLGREIKFVEVPFEDLIDALNDGKIDIIMSSMSVTRAREFRVAFSDPYLRISQLALVRAGDTYMGLFAESLAKKTVGVKKGTTGDLLAQQEFPKAKRKTYKSGDDAAKALIKKNIDLFVDDSTMVWYLAGVYEADGLVVMPMLLSDESLAWAVNRSDPKLLASVNEFQKKLRASGELDKILHRWIPKLK